MIITMIRGDYKLIKFPIKSKDGTDFNVDVDEIYITFKHDCYTKDVLFQKRLSKEDIVKKEDGYYHFAILPEDTEKLSYGEYYFDIQICNETPKIKQTFLGKLSITEEVTFAENEV